MNGADPSNVTTKISENKNKDSQVAIILLNVVIPRVTLNGETWMPIAQ